MKKRKPIMKGAIIIAIAVLHSVLSTLIMKRLISIDFFSMANTVNGHGEVLIRDFIEDAVITGSYSVR